MDTDRWHFWGHTDHQGTLIISALMITVSVRAREERNADIFGSFRRSVIRCVRGT
ncbi:unnamed protein product, partial [Staurois parvus]